MKMHLVLAAFAAVCSHAAFAASEGGDTGSEVQSLQQSTYPIAQSAPRVDPAPALDAPFEGSEGGDTWSSVQALPSGEQVAQGRPGRPTTEYTRLAGGSEGGDTWSRLVPQFYGTPATATSGDRTIYVGPNSHKVNVAYGETVRFVAESGNAPERSFAWRFDVIPEGTSVDLSKVAPVDFPSHNVRVIVSPDPLYAGG